MTNEKSNDIIISISIDDNSSVYTDITFSSASEMEAWMSKLSEVKKQHGYSIWQTKEGKYATTYRDRDGKRHKLEYVNYRSLINKLDKIYRETKENKTISDMYHEWRDERELNEEVSRATIDRCESSYQRFFVTTGWANRPIKDITRNELEGFIKEQVREHELSRKGYAHLKALILSIFRRAHHDGYTDISVRVFFDEFNVPKRMFKSNKKSDEEQIFNDMELRKITQYLKKHPDNLNLALLLDFYTGLRCGELCALKKEDLVRDRYLHIRRTETREKGRGKDGGSTVVVEHPKTDAGNRLVYLSDEALDVVKTFLDDPIAKDSEWLIIGQTNHNRVIRSSISHRLTNVCRKLNIPPRSPHKIRKTYASQLIDSGVNENVIIKQLGHVDIQTTKDYYYFAHQTDDMKAYQLEKAVANFM